uniref:Uncharacterized protein n=1 Tax=Romanomermis culicivorax TaxID=13658 RepID=A0A915I964_ROMCU
MVTFVYSCLNEEHSKEASAGDSNVSDFPVHLSCQKLNVNSKVLSSSSVISSLISSRSPGGDPGRRNSSSDGCMCTSPSVQSRQNIDKQKNRDDNSQDSKNINQMVGRLSEITSREFIRDFLDTKC